MIKKIFSYARLTCAWVFAGLLINRCIYKNKKKSRNAHLIKFWSPLNTPEKCKYHWRGVNPAWLKKIHKIKAILFSFKWLASMSSSFVAYMSMHLFTPSDEIVRLSCVFILPIIPCNSTASLLLLQVFFYFGWWLIIHIPNPQKERTHPNTPLIEILEQLEEKK